jgi:hypothetical protein
MVSLSDGGMVCNRRRDTYIYPMRRRFMVRDGRGYLQYAGRLSVDEREFPAVCQNTLRRQPAGDRRHGERGIQTRQN